MTKQREYHVVWEIDIFAESAEAAAAEALRIQRDPESTATVFDVLAVNSDCQHKIDLEEVRAHRNKKQKKVRKG